MLERLEARNSLAIPSNLHIACVVIYILNVYV